MNTHPPSAALWRGLGVSLLLLIGLTACQTPEYETYPQTKILEFRIEPNENVQVGDTLFLTCRIRDSLDSRFNFYWSGHYEITNLNTNDYRLYKDVAPFLDGEIVEYRETDFYWTGKGHTNRWIVPDCTGYFKSIFYVDVDNFDPNERAVFDAVSILINGGDQ